MFIALDVLVVQVMRGVAITFVSHQDEKYLAGVQAFIHQEISVMTLDGEKSAPRDS